MDFSKKIEKITCYGVIAMTMQLAKELGIFKVLHSADQPLTSQQVADAGRLKERYVREILGCLTSSGVVELSTGPEPQTPLYHLGLEAKEALDQGALCMTGFISVLMEAYVPVKACCHLDGPKGVRINDEEYKVLDERHVAYGDEIVGYFCSKIPGLQSSLEQGIQVLEVGSGTGRLLSKLAERFPKSTFTASDVNEQVIQKLKDSCGKLPNTRFGIVDLCRMTDFPFPKYDWIFCVEVLHDLPHPGVALKNIRQMLKEDSGYFTTRDMACPGNQMATVGNVEAACLYGASTFMCIPESFQQEDSEAHGCVWGKDTAVSLMEQAGFTVQVDMHNEFEGYYICQCKI